MFFSELCNKEVVSAVTGARLGFVDDAEIDPETFKVTKLFIYGKGELLGLMGRQDDIVIEREDIDTVGSDVIIINKSVEKPQASKKKSLFGL